jgi:hypothetical protein
MVFATTGKATAAFIGVKLHVQDFVCTIWV